MSADGPERGAAYDGPDEEAALGLRGVGLRPVLRLEVAASEPVQVSAERRYVPLVGGTFETRDGVRGVVLPGGSDWQHILPDGTVELEAHYALRSDDGGGVEVLSTGVRRAAPEVMARLAAGEPVDPDDYYFRTHIRLSAATGDLAALDHLIGVSTGQRDRDVVHIHIHEVL